MSRKRIMALVVKEWREIVRDRMFFALAFVMPILWMWIFGAGLTYDVEHTPFAVVDYDHSAMSREYTARFIASRYFEFKGMVSDERELDALLAEGRLRLALVIPEQFQERLMSGLPVAVQSLIDGTFPFRAETTKGYVVSMNNAINAELMTRTLSHQEGVSPQTAASRVRSLTLETRYLYNQEVRSIWFLAPALMMFVLMISSPLLTTLGVVREKESGSIYNIYASTISRGEFLLGKLLPRVMISAINALLLWFMATELFGAPFKGNGFFFFLVSLLYVICTTGIGLFVSLLVSTQVAALIITVILTMVPTILYSGMFIPLASLDAAAQFEARLFPAMYFTNVVLGTFLKGVGLEALWLDVLALALYTVALFVVSYLLFHKRPAI